MKTFVATTEERYVWDCPHCGKLCEDDCDDPADQLSVFCEHCQEESFCERTDR